MEEGREFIKKKKLTEDFVKLVLDSYPLDQLANLVIWMHQSTDEDVVYFAHWLDLGDTVEYLIREFEIDLDEILDEVMMEKRRLADEAADEEYQRFLDARR